MMWKIDKQFSFCYGHRVWSQILNGEFCETVDEQCKCRHLHGHEALVHVFLEGSELVRGMVTDFKHLGWLKKFLDENIDHKFILDQNDPSAELIINGLFQQIADKKVVVTAKGVKLPLIPVKIPSLLDIVGYQLDVDHIESSLNREFYQSFFIVDFVPTSENLSKWLYDVAYLKMKKMGISVSRVDWFETPKSRSTFSGH